MPARRNNRNNNNKSKTATTEGKPKPEATAVPNPAKGRKNKQKTQAKKKSPTTTQKGNGTLKHHENLPPLQTMMFPLLDSILPLGTNFALAAVDWASTVVLSIPIPKGVEGVPEAAFSFTVPRSAIKFSSLLNDLLADHNNTDTTIIPLPNTNVLALRFVVAWLYHFSTLTAEGKDEKPTDISPQRLINNSLKDQISKWENEFLFDNLYQEVLPVAVENEKKKPQEPANVEGEISSDAPTAATTKKPGQVPEEEANPSGEESQTAKTEKDDAEKKKTKQLLRRDDRIILDVMKLAHFLHIQPLVSLCAAAVGEHMHAIFNRQEDNGNAAASVNKKKKKKGGVLQKKVQQVREAFGVTNDFPSKRESELKEAYKWTL